MTKPLIVQSDFSVLLEVEADPQNEARNAIALFAELVKAPEYIHTYLISPLSIWNASSLGISGRNIIAALTKFSKFPLSESVQQEILELAGRYGQCTLYRRNGQLYLDVENDRLGTELTNSNAAPFLQCRVSDCVFEVSNLNRGPLKQALVDMGYPPKDHAGFDLGDSLDINLLPSLPDGTDFTLREYQDEAIKSFNQKEGGCGHGVILLPCGAGKTIVGLGVMTTVKQHTLILTTGLSSARQWRSEILSKTDLDNSQISEYSSKNKQIAPVTISTYQMMSYRNQKQDKKFPHFDLFTKNNWGLIIYDEIHLLPAPVFRITAELQAKRRLGLTATLIREDGREKDVFALVGPKRYEVPWRTLEESGHIATAECTEIRIPMSYDYQGKYSLASSRSRFRVAAENPNKLGAIKEILSKEKRKSIIIGEYLTQLEAIASQIGFPIITGKTKQEQRDETYNRFRRGEIQGLILSRVGNFAIDLPDAEVLIQVSGKFGSRQEEAQRLGRILRPKANAKPASFFTLVSSQSCEEKFARNRQVFLAEQGYEYTIVDASAEGRCSLG